MDGERVLPAVDRPGFAAAKADLDRRLEAIPSPEPPPEKPKAVAAAAGPAPSAAVAAAPVDKSGKPSRQARQVASPAAIASAAAEPGIHPSAFVEDDGKDDDDEPLPTPSKKPPTDDDAD
jgi:hypothetical protein